MENAWQLFLRQLASADPEFTYDDVCGWSTDEFEALTAAGLISEMAQATHVSCEACPEAHWERVRWSEDGHRAFIPCPLAGTPDVNLERLRRWRGSPKQLAVLLAQALALSGEIEPLPASRIWFLGRRRASGRTPYFFFAAIGPDELPAMIEAVRLAYGRVAGVLFVPFSPPTSTEGGKVRTVDIGKAASLQDRRMTVDLPFVEVQLGDERPPGMSAKHPPKSLRDHRRAILQAYMESKEIEDMNALGSHLRMDRSALYGMVRSDKSKYGESSLKAMLTKIGCPRPTWDRAAKPGRA
jgi:hypothetical protein